MLIYVVMYYKYTKIYKLNNGCFLSLFINDKTETYETNILRISEVNIDEDNQPKLNIANSISLRKKRN